MSKNHFSKITGIIFLTFSLFSFIPKHAIHLSITEMDFEVKGEKTEIQISHKIFIDDLEKALRKNYEIAFEKNKPNLSTKTQHKEIDRYIYDYLKKVVDLKINSQKTEINYIGLEFEDDVIWVYGIIEKPTSAEEKESIFIKNMILMDLFNDQRNMLYLTKEKNKKFLNFTNDERTETILF
ncbi:hypothetical protein Fleli_3275 [Bernardetia litoralis DSM 6794]|uniref:Peptidase E n=1 Tax=Bernardetia litoralis (strain ATCC 23117 / DSM 6794 / NBRC 15988 / NCIMB 1366 / Fx l1 / Sio-4) TaxID=880071 RepID=I4ANS0_BERLS|nr:DUF6702 family protein [Bernardetia litoralis]AFM05605.1 hypothetical protein Fleli_3275 [Bernardetia litoralis DSM 6794]